MRFHSNFILFYISTNSTHCLQFLHFLASTCYFLYFYFLIRAFPMDVRWFWLVFPYLWQWASFCLLLDHFYIFFGEICIQVLCPVFIWVICKGGGFIEVLYIFWILILNLFGCVISSTVSHSGDCLFVILFELKHSSKRNFISYWAYFGMRPIGKKARPVLLKAVVFLWE